MAILHLINMTLLNLMETSPEHFYEHCVAGEEKVEIMYSNHIWKYKKLTSLEWIIVSSPYLISNLNIEQLDFMFTHYLLTQYCAYKMFSKEEFRKKQIEFLLGSDRCQLAEEEWEQFALSLGGIIKDLSKPKLSLIKN